MIREEEKAAYTVKIFFFRHGESKANILHEFSNRGLKHGLTEKGKTQVLSLLNDLQDVVFHKLYSSPLLRAIETAEILSNKYDIPYEINKSLILKNIDFSFALKNPLNNTSYVIAEYLEGSFNCIKFGKDVELYDFVYLAIIIDDKHLFDV